LIAAGWTITHDPLVLKVGTNSLPGNSRRDPRRPFPRTDRPIAPETPASSARRLRTRTRSHHPVDTQLDSHRAIIEQVLTEYSKYPYAYGEIERQLVFDRSRDHYLLMSVGWDKRRVHGCLVHIDLINGKCWIQRDGTESGIACDLEAAGIPKDRIVLAFRPPAVRPHTGYAVA
jgi:XisI protein